MKTTILEAGGTTVAPDDVEGIKKAIEEYYGQFKHRLLKGPKKDVVEKYNRVNLTGQLVRIFESLFEP